MSNLAPREMIALFEKSGKQNSAYRCIRGKIKSVPTIYRDAFDFTPWFFKTMRPVPYLARRSPARPLLYFFHAGYE